MTKLGTMLQRAMVALVTGDHAIRRMTTLVVLAVAAFAAVVSYSHIYELARDNGQTGTAARLLPLSVDGLIAAASLVLLHEARARHEPPKLARCMLGLGVAATVGANVAYGLPFGWVGALVSAWPALAFIGSVEMLMHLVRAARTGTPAKAAGSRARTAPETVPGAPSEGVRTKSRKRARARARNRAPVTPQDAEIHYAADLANGTMPAVRQIRSDLHVGTPRAQEIRAHLESVSVRT
jgi:hypothetical protein